MKQVSKNTRSKVSQTKLSEQTQDKLIKLYGTTYSALQEVTEGYLALRNYSLSEIKKIGFTNEDLTALIDSLNSVMIESSMSCITNVLVAQMEDFESTEAGISRNGANPKELITKLSKLTSAQCHFMQSEIRRFWDKNITDNPISLDDFVKTLMP